MAEFARLWTTFTGRRVIGLTTSTNAARVLAARGPGRELQHRRVPRQDRRLRRAAPPRPAAPGRRARPGRGQPARHRRPGHGRRRRPGRPGPGSSPPATPPSSARSKPAACSGCSPTKSPPRSCTRSAGSTRPGNGRPASGSATATWPRSPPTTGTAASAAPTTKPPTTAPPPCGSPTTCAARTCCCSPDPTPKPPTCPAASRPSSPSSAPSAHRRPRCPTATTPASATWSAPASTPRSTPAAARSPTATPSRSPHSAAPTPRSGGSGWTGPGPGRSGSPGPTSPATPSSPTPATSTSPRAAPSTPPTSWSPTRLSRQALYVGMTRGRQANTAHVVTGKTAPPGHKPYQQATPEAVLASIMSRDDGDLSATEQIRQAQDWAAGTGHLLTLWSAAIRQTLYPDIDQQIKARLTESEAWRYQREHSRQALQQQLRAAQLAGHDISALIEQITAAPMDGARSIASVLHGRLQRFALPKLAGHDLDLDAAHPRHRPARRPRTRRRSRRPGPRPRRPNGHQPRTLASPSPRRPCPHRVSRTTRGIHAPRGPGRRLPGSRRDHQPRPSRLPRAASRQPRTRSHASGPSLPPLRSATKPTSFAAWTAANSKHGSSPVHAPAAPRPTSASSSASPRRPKPTPCSNLPTPRSSATPPARPARRPSPGNWPPNGTGSKSAATGTERGPPTPATSGAAADKARAELLRRGPVRPEGEPQAQVGDESQMTAGWWRDYEADHQAVERAIARQHQAAVDTGEPWPPQRAPEPNLSSALRAGCWADFGVQRGGS